MIKLWSLLTENFQLANKVYAGKLSAADIDFLTSLCNKDYTFKTLTDLLMEEKSNTGGWPWTVTQWKRVVVQLRNYNKNVFPIQNFSFDSRVPVVNKKMLEHRENILKTIATWPPNARRNLRQEIRLPRKDFYRLDDRINYIEAHLSYLNNRSPEQKATILNKIFSSDHATFEDVLDFVEDKENLLQGKAFSKQELYKIVEKNDYDLKIIYDKGDIVIVDVTGQSGIKDIGCNSIWCFTYGNEYGRAGEHWDTYSTNDHVYAIINFKESQSSPEFIHILIKPFDKQSEDESHLYDMKNDQTCGRAENTIQHITGDPSVLKLFTFDD